MLKVFKVGHYKTTNDYNYACDSSNDDIAVINVINDNIDCQSDTGSKTMFFDWDTSLFRPCILHIMLCTAWAGDRPNLKTVSQSMAYDALCGILNFAGL